MCHSILYLILLHCLYVSCLKLVVHAPGCFLCFACNFHNKLSAFASTSTSISWQSSDSCLHIMEKRQLHNSEKEKWCAVSVYAARSPATHTTQACSVCCWISYIRYWLSLYDGTQHYFTRWSLWSSDVSSCSRSMPLLFLATCWITSHLVSVPHILPIKHSVKAVFILLEYWNKQTIEWTTMTILYAETYSAMIIWRQLCPTQLCSN